MRVENKRNYLKENGITLIALVVTIVVLLILAGVSVNALFGNSGIIEKAKEAQNKMNKATENDQKQIGELTNWLDNQVNGTTGSDDNQTTLPKISTLVETVVDKNTKAEDAYGNKITIPKGFKILKHNPTSSTGAVTYNYTNSKETGEHIPAVQDGIVIENGTDGNQFVWVPVGTIKNKDNTTNTITLGRYSNFTKQNGNYVPAQTAENYKQETVIRIGSTQNQNYTIAKLGLESEKENKVRVNKAIQLEGILENVEVIKTAPVQPSPTTYDYKEISTFRDGSKSDGSENATARDLKTFIETSQKNGGYYIARFEASETTSKITSKYNQTVLTNITQPNAAKLAREMYGEVKENNKLVYASDLVNSYAWDTAIIFIQTYSAETDASSYASENKSTSFAKTGINPDKYCNIWDMSGNAYEWTTEYSAISSLDDSYPCVIRGGSCNGAGGKASFDTSHRDYKFARTSYSLYGLRPLLYVK